MENSLQNYSALIKEIKELVYRRQYEAMKQVNAELIALYWDIGAKISSQQEEAGWASLWLIFWRGNCKRNFRAYRGFLPEIYGECAISIWNILPIQFCHH